jgi:BirA family biotin operon repressor/biotin-[acetyl-CoA-carboxylase] ligase
VKRTAAERLLGRVIHRLREVDSTQAELARLADRGAPEGTVVSAEHQTRGRGRLGRRWLDAPGESLLVSILLRPAVEPARAPQLSLVAAVAVVDALQAGPGVRALIRWPNDVLLDGRKACGILLEASTTGARLQDVLLGIGLNVNQTDFPPEIRDRATSLRLVTGLPQDRDALLERLLDALDDRYAEFRARGFAGVRGEWLRRAATIGQRVRAPGGDEGVAVDLDEDGALLVRGDGGAVIRIASGEPLHAPGH